MNINKENIMKKWFVPIILPSLLSCQITQNDNFYHLTHNKNAEIDSYELPRHAINDLAKGLAYQMLKSSNFVNTSTPVAVASFVDLKDLESTNWLGNQLAESFVHELQHHGLVVIDYKTTGSIRVSSHGDYVFSRDWQELPERQLIDYVVSGTMVTQEEGVLVNARMIGIQSKVVVATAQSFIPNWVLGGEMNHNENVKMIDNMIIRDNAMLTPKNSNVSIKN